MASEQLQIDIIAPNGTLFNGMGDMVIVPGDNGDMGILAGHADTIAALRPGVLWFYTGGKLSKKFFLSGGFADISQKKVVILATAANDVATLDSKDIEKQIKDFTDELKNTKDAAQQAIVNDKLAVARAALSAISEKLYS
ncbi:MAG: ATP synthase F1 subunit epsilon [Hydrotalea sp.]|nr:ATP synthase F1 subunit epsilon [Hydrotalea sp.]